jgi:hypothetical protein
VNFSNNKVFEEGTEIAFPYKQYLIVEFLAKNQ